MSTMTRSSNGRSRGFTLIELMVLLSILISRASMGLAQYRNSIVRANEAVLKEDLFRMRDAIDQYYADKGQYPTALDALASEGYLRRMPDDPFTKSSSSWQAVPAEPDPEQSKCERGSLRRQERIGRHRTGRLEVRGLVGRSAQSASIL